MNEMEGRPAEVAEAPRAEVRSEDAAVSRRPTFAEMNLDPAIQQALDEMGYQVPMEVQHAIYDKVMEGRDLMVQSRTGSGKTAAFGIPIAQKIPPGSRGVQALVLAPTRELALQISTEIGRITAYRNVQVVPVYGGAPMGKQIEALKAGAQIVVGTPGRVLDHLRRGTLKVDGVTTLVLDECDEMLSMGFQEEIEKIISYLPKDRQTLLFSATVPEEIERIGRRHMREYEKVQLSTGFVGVQEIRHQYYLVNGLTRTRDLLRILELEQPESAIIFCNTREDVAMVSAFLQRHGYDAEGISSDLTQSERERVMGRMREKNLRFLVATDIAARGIDISDLSHVINYTFPESPEVYIHRTGRTGRAGKSGVAISLIGPREIGAFYYLKLLYKIKPEERELPSEVELRTRREADRYAKVVAEITEEPGDEYRSLARRVWQSGEGERIVAALLKRLLEGAPRMIAERLAKPERPERPERDRGRERGRERDRGKEDRGGPGPEERGARESRRETSRGERAEARREQRGEPRAERERSGERAEPRRGERGEPRAERERSGERAEPRRGERGESRAERKRSGEPAEPRRGERGEPRAERERSPERPERDSRSGVETRSEHRERPRASGFGRELERPEGDTREFWEAWVDDKAATSDALASPPAGAPSAAPVATGAVPPAEPTEAAGDDPRPGAPSRERRRRPEEPIEPGYVRLYVNVGKREKLKSEDVARIVAEAAPEHAAAIGRITVLGTHSYVTVREEVSDAIIAALKGRTMGDREIVAERAKK